jgi:hypothetical protein
MAREARVIVPIRGSNPSSTTDRPWLDTRKLVAGMSEDELKQVIDSQVAASLASYLQQPARVSNPFDAIYLSDLRPDTLPRGAVSRLIAHRRIVDLSENIIFSDDV